MNVVIHSHTGDCLPLGLRLQDEGHTVGIFLDDEATSLIGSGLLYHVPDFFTAIDEADLILFDYVGAGSLADRLREEGHAVIGAGKFQDILELDRLRGSAILRAAGVRMPETVDFPDADFQRAIAFIEADGGRWVFKPSDNVAADKTYPADDADDMIAYLERMEETLEATEGKRPKFLLQRFVPGVEVSSERWYANGRPILAMDNHTFETKKFLAGDLGVAVGCSGNVVCPYGDPRLAHQTVEHMDRLARLHDIDGPIDLNAIVSEEDQRAYVLEVTGRFGYYAIEAYCALWGMPIGETLFEIATGEQPKVRFTAEYGAAIPVSIAPFPSSTEEARGTPIEDDLEDPRIWPKDVMVDAQDRLVVAGLDDVVYLVTGTGSSIEAAFAPAYRWLRTARMPHRQYRIDLVETLAPRLEQLQDWGYFREPARGAA